MTVRTVRGPNGPKPIHVCDLPRPEYQSYPYHGNNKAEALKMVGVVVVCDECKQWWRAIEEPYENSYRRYIKWVPVGPWQKFYYRWVKR